MVKKWMHIYKYPIILCSIIVIIFVTFWLSQKGGKRQEGITTNKENVKRNNENNVQIIISRYNEDLAWLNEAPFNKYPNIIYNKGTNDHFVVNENTIDIVPLKNVGREGETYLQHILLNYKDLADINVFLPGSTNKPEKRRKAEKLLENIEHYDTVFVGTSYNNVRKDLYNFIIDEYVSSHEGNKRDNPENELEMAPQRPFGCWYDTHFTHDIDFVAYNGIFAVSRRNIQQHSRDYYKKLIRQLQNTSNPEVGHYFERAWVAVFAPCENARFVTIN